MLVALSAECPASVSGTAVSLGTDDVAKMGLVAEQIRLLDDQVAEKARAVRDAHQSAEWNYQTSHVETDPMSEIEMLAADNLDELHAALIDTFKAVTKLQKKPKAKKPKAALNGRATKKAIP